MDDVSFSLDVHAPARTQRRGNDRRQSGNQQTHGSLRHSRTPPHLRLDPRSPDTASKSHSVTFALAFETLFLIIVYLILCAIAAKLVRITLGMGRGMDTPARTRFCRSSDRPRWHGGATRRAGDRDRIIDQASTRNEGWLARAGGVRVLPYLV